ncbi:unnamed protein product [Orchesella dallaii]|uniref:Uncharacterized protein n=1 Tax=Orchesella dallaii TaxID=48710 RepID=A0ABP1RS46_9HEXA
MALVAAGENLLVGDEGCKFKTICHILIQSNSALENWEEVGQNLDLPPDSLFSISTQLKLGLLTCYGVYSRMLEGFRQKKASKATLGLLIETLDRCEVDDSPDALRKEFRIPIPPFSHRRRKGIKFEVRKQSHLCITREDEINELHTKLLHALPNMKMVAISGLGGIGKTVLCHQYIDTHGDSYQDIIWIIANNKANVEATFRRLADDDRVGTSSKTKNGEIKDIKTVMEQVYTFFAKRKPLFIFDNVNRKEDISEFLPHFYLFTSKSTDQIPPRPQILMTSRISVWNPRQYLSYELIGIEKELALTFMLSRLGMGIEDEDTADARTLVEILSHRILQCYPLALQQAIAYIAHRQRFSTRYSVENYIQDYTTMRETLLNSVHFRDEGLQDLYDNTTFTTWHITIERISKEHKLALAVFNVMAYLNPDRIERSMFDGLEQCESRDLEDAVDVLVGLSMITSNSEEGESQSVLTVHRLVQDVTREKLKADKKEVPVLETSLRIVSQQELSNQLQHAAAVWSHASKHSKLIDLYYHDSVYGRGEETPLHLLSNRDLGENSEAFKEIVNHFRTTCQFYVGLFRIINASDNFDRTPVWIASQTGNDMVLEVLINEEADLAMKSNILTFHAVNKTDPHSNVGETPLHAAARNGHTNCVRLLVNAEPALKQLRNNSKRTPATVAALNGRTEVVKILEPGQKLHLLHAKLHNKTNDFQEFQDFVKELDERERVNLLNNGDFNATVMQQATFQGYPPSLLEFLKENGAKVVLQGRYGPLHCAAGYGNVEAVKYLCSLKEEGVHPLHNVTLDGEWTPVQEACRRGNLETIRYFIEEYDYEDIPIEHVLNVQGVQKTTPLITAAYHGKIDVLKFLLSKGANVNLGNCWGATPTIAAALMGFFDCVEEILNTRRSEVVMDLAKVSGNKDTILAQLGVSLLHIAAAYDKLDIAKRLVEQESVDVDFGKERSCTPLHVAVFFGSKKVTNYLVKMGADVNAKIEIDNIISCGYDCIENGPLNVGDEKIMALLKYVHRFRNVLNFAFGFTPGSICKLGFSQIEIHELGNGGRKAECSGYFRILRWLLSIDFVKKYVVVLLDFVHSHSKNESGKIDLVVQGTEIENIKRLIGFHF